MKDAKALVIKHWQEIEAEAQYWFRVASILRSRRQSSMMGMPLPQLCSLPHVSGDERWVFMRKSTPRTRG